MESRLAWRRVLLAADRHDVTVICGPKFSLGELRGHARDQGVADRIEFHSVEHDFGGKLLLASRWLWYTGYSRWQHRVLRLAQRLHADRPFDLVHQVNYAGYREPGVAWRLGLPFIWGPVGGTQSFPLRFLRYAGVVGGIREVGRNLLNFYQLHYSRRVGRAAKAATVVVAATNRCRDDLSAARQIGVRRELETGVDCPIGPRRVARDPAQPLKVLAAGRLQPWKGVPLLIHAIAALPADMKVQVRVLGDGPCRNAWRRLAERKGVADRFEFISWPRYEETLPHYRWADVFAFTSLRDTSGTGLLESLASGTPILGVNHQGAADVMTEQCAIKVSVNSPQEAIDGFATGLRQLANDRELWTSLSRGAQKRAYDYCWDRRIDSTNELYARAMRGSAATAAPVVTGKSSQRMSPPPVSELVASRHG